MSPSQSLLRPSVVPCPVCMALMLQEPYGEAVWYQCPNCRECYPSIRDRIKLIREECDRERKVGAEKFGGTAEKFFKNALRVGVEKNISGGAAEISDACARGENESAVEFLRSAPGSESDSTDVGENRMVVDSVEFPNDRIMVYSTHCS